MTLSVIPDNVDFDAPPDFQIAASVETFQMKGAEISMQELQPIGSIRAFFDSKFTYVLPAPGGSLANGGMKTNDTSDLYLAALASKAKKRRGDNRNPLEYLAEHCAILKASTLFDAATDVKIIRRVQDWIRELSN